MCMYVCVTNIMHPSIQPMYDPHFHSQAATVIRRLHHSRGRFSHNKAQSLPFVSSALASLIFEVKKVLPPVSGWFNISNLRCRSRIRSGGECSLHYERTNRDTTRQTKSIVSWVQEVRREGSAGGWTHRTPRILAASLLDISSSNGPL